MAEEARKTVTWSAKKEWCQLLVDTMEKTVSACRGDNYRDWAKILKCYHTFTDIYIGSVERKELAVWFDKLAALDKPPLHIQNKELYYKMNAERILFNLQRLLVGKTMHVLNPTSEADDDVEFTFEEML